MDSLEVIYSDSRSRDKNPAKIRAAGFFCSGNAVSEFGFLRTLMIIFESVTAALTGFEPVFSP